MRVFVTAGVAILAVATGGNNSDNGGVCFGVAGFAPASSAPANGGVGIGAGSRAHDGRADAAAAAQQQSLLFMTAAASADGVDTAARAAPVDSNGDSDDADNDDDIFPPPLSRIDALQRAATFWTSALPIIASYYTKSGELLLREKLLGETVTDEQRQAIWDEEHAKGSAQLASTITSLKGFYVKTAQIIASRQDLFPSQYTEALSGFTDNLDPMSVELARAVVTKELLHADETFEEVFREFDDVPLGAASIAQVHRAVLTEKYGGPREVAVKIQRPRPACLPPHRVPPY